MFLWKNAVVLVVLLGAVTLPASMLVRARWEKLYLARLFCCAVIAVCLALSALPMIATQIGYLLLLTACFDRRLPMAATYLFFLLWTPAAGSLLAVSGAYIAPITPFLTFSGALLLGYLLHPESHQKRTWVASDLAVLGFTLIYCICMSLRDTPTGVARTVVTFLVPYVLSYQIVSRVRLGSPEIILRLFVVAAAAAGLLCLFESLRHWPLYAGIMGVKNDIWTVDAPRTWLERGGIARAYGPFAHPLTGGAMLGLAAVAAWGLSRIRGVSGPLALLGALILVGLGATLSRSGLVAVAVGLMVFQFLRGRYLLAILVPLAGLVIVFGLPILGGEDARFNAAYRIGLLSGVPRALGGHMWLGYREAVAQGMLDSFIQGQGIVDLVNAYLALLVEGGLVTVVAFLLFILSAYPHYRAIKRLQPGREQLIFAQVLISIHSATAVSLALLSSWVAPMQLSFIMVALLVALRTQLAADRAASRARPALVATAPEELGERLPVLR
jgi:hypothetical protein